VDTAKSKELTNGNLGEWRNKTKYSDLELLYYCFYHGQVENDNSSLA